MSQDADWGIDQQQPLKKRDGIKLKPLGRKSYLVHLPENDTATDIYQTPPKLFEEFKIGILHLRRRIKFYLDGKKSMSSASFPSMILVFDRRG
jgi:hypothetical protein